jgi:hypothetical protein
MTPTGQLRTSARTIRDLAQLLDTSPDPDTIARIEHLVQPDVTLEERAEMLDCVTRLTHLAPRLGVSLALEIMTVLARYYSNYKELSRE